MSLQGKQIGNCFKDILQVDNSNNGISSVQDVKDGKGTTSSLKLGASNAYIIPSANSTTNFQVLDADGNTLFRVSGNNKSVGAGVSLSNVNTQYLRFGAKDIDVDSGTHIGVPIAGMGANAVVTFGTSANPAVPTQTVTADDWIHYLHYVDTNITVDAVNVLVGANAATSGSTNFHLVGLSTGDTTTVDEFSSATIVADQSSPTTNSGYEQFYRVPLDIQSADIDAGDYLVLTIEGSATSSDISVNALVKYHLR